MSRHRQPAPKENSPGGLNDTDTIEDAFKRADVMSSPDGLRFSGIMCRDKDVRRIVLLTRELRKLQKPVVDEQKKRIAEALISKAITFESGFCGCEHCHSVDERFESLVHRDGCIVTEAKQYLEGLEGE